MSKGAILIARNNGQLDYVKQAVFLANRIKKYLEIPVSIITDSPEYVKNSFPEDTFDQIIITDYVNSKNNRAFYDGSLSYKIASFKNDTRSNVYQMSPYDETLLLDTDYIISNDLFKNCFNSTHDFLIFKESEDVAKIRNENEFKHISDYSIDFYWATVVFFRKTEQNKIFFDLVSHIQTEWKHYSRIYQLSSPLFRNDFAFSIAIHIMNGFEKGDFAAPLPGKHLYTIDKDILYKLQDDKMTFLVEKKDYLGEYTAIHTRGQSVHVMNKFSLERIIDNAQ